MKKISKLIILIIMTVIVGITLMSCDSLTKLLETQADDDTTDDDTTDDDTTDNDTIGYDVLGRGYDVFDEYADPEQVKAAILDIDALQNDNLVEKTTLEKGEFSSSSGSSLEEYSESFNIKTNMDANYRYYSGSIKSSFSSSSRGSTSNQFATVHSDIKKYALSVTDRTSPDSLRPYLTATFKERLNDSTYSTSDLFTIYGTHLLTGIIIGARLDYSLTAEETDSSGSEKIASYASFSYNSLFASANIDVTANSDYSWSEYYSSKEVKTTVIGGSSEYGQNIQNDGDYSLWIDSIAANPVFSNVRENGIMPIWQLVDSDNATRKAELETAFETWAEDRTAFLSETTTVYDCIVDIRILNNDQGVTNEYNDGTYYRINLDLNEGAGGDSIYIYVLYGDSNGSSSLKPITDIAILLDGDSQDAIDDMADDYTRVEQDLNDEAGGDFIYLCYKRSDSSPITNLRVFNDTDNKQTHPSYHDNDTYTNLIYKDTYRMRNKTITSEKVDLNKEAGGDYIYLLYSTETP